MENPDLDVAEVGGIARAYLALPTCRRGVVPSAPSNGGQGRYIEQTEECFPMKAGWWRNGSLWGDGVSPVWKQVG